MQDSSAFQFLAIDTIHESTTNPRKTFDEAKLYELAESIRQHGLIQPITVRPNNQGFEIVAGARRFRAAQIADLFSLPARIVEITDVQAIEWQLVENSQRADVHPYEEAQGFQRLLDMPGYDVATLAEKSGKSVSHIYARLSLLQLIPEVAEAFLQDRITVSHANLIARLPREAQAQAFAQCWRKDWSDAEAHLLPAKFLSSWIQNNLYLALASAPFDREDATLNPVAGACTTCPRRSGYNTALFADVLSDECLDGECYRSKIAAHIDREVAAHPEYVQIETSWRNRNGKRPGALERGEYEILDTPENPDAEPPCPSTRTALIVYGKQVGTTVSVCTDEDCPVHHPTESKPEPVFTPSPVTTAQPHDTAEPIEEEETEGEKQHREEQQEGQRLEHERLAEERRIAFERQQQEYEAEQTRRAELQAERNGTFERILENAPPTLSPAQWTAFLRALIHVDPHTFTDDVAAALVGDDENNQQSAEEVLVTILDGTADDRLPAFALRLALTGHTALPREGEIDFLQEAEIAFASSEAKKTAHRKQRKPTAIKAARAKKAKVRAAA